MLRRVCACFSGEYAAIQEVIDYVGRATLKANIDAEGVIFSAGLSLTRHPAYRGQMTDVMRVYGAQGMKVSAAIYAHAWRLWRKGVAFVRHPKHQS